MSVTNTPSMNLPVPGVGTEAGPDYAFDINSCMSLIDSHDHSTGKGVQIKTAGLNIDQPLSFNSNTAINLTALTMLTQTTAPAIQSIYVKAAGTSPVINELWYIDSVGQQVQLTSNGIVNVTATSITGVTYAAGTFTFTQAQDALPTTPASLSAGNVTLKPIVASTPYSVTLTPPAGIASQYNIAMPLLPSVPSFMVIDNSGNETATIAVNQGITDSNIAPLTITGAKIANQTITPNKMAQSASTVTSGPYVITDADTVIFYDASAGAIATTLPTPVGIAGRVYNLKKVDASMNIITIGTAAGNIEGLATITLNTISEEWAVTSDGTNWQITAHKTRTAPVQLASPVFGGWTSFSATNIYSYREGNNLVYFGTFVAQGPTAGAVMLGFGFNGSNNNVNLNSTIISSTQNSIIGSWGSDNSPGNNGSGIVANGPVWTNTNGSSTLIYFGQWSTTNSPLSVIAGNTTGGNGNHISFTCVIPISGWFS